jgi:glycosyltransferase involved in cell wall biosynthesis
MFFPNQECWLLPFAPTVVTVHDLATTTLLKGMVDNPIDKIQKYLQLRFIKRHARRIVTDSTYSAKLINKLIGVDESKITTIYLGVNSMFCPGTSNDKTKRFILFVGGFDRRKNIERLFLAYRSLINRGITIPLFLVGIKGANAKLYYDMPALLKKNDIEQYVTIFEDVSDEQLLGFYQQATLMVMPSLIEGFGLPVLEAMACGCPVACSNAASLPEVGGDAVLYFDPYDVIGMAEVISAIMEDKTLREGLIRRGLDRSKHFNWVNTASLIYKGLNSAVQVK